MCVVAGGDGCSTRMTLIKLNKTIFSLENLLSSDGKNDFLSESIQAISEVFWNRFWVVGP